MEQTFGGMRLHLFPIEPADTGMRDADLDEVVPQTKGVRSNVVREKNPCFRALRRRPEL